MSDDTDRSARALAAADAMGLSYQVTRHGPVRSLAEAAAARGVEPAAVVKTMVVRLAEDDYRFVLVPVPRIRPTVWSLDLDLGAGQRLTRDGPLLQPETIAKVRAELGV